MLDSDAWIIVVIAILVFLSYFHYKGNTRRFFIASNKLMVIKYYQKLLFFLFGVLTFLYGIHDTLIDERERDHCYSINIPPFIEFCNLVEETHFAKKGHFLSNKDLEPIQHGCNNVDYLFILDRTKSVYDVIDSYYLMNHLTKTLSESYGKLENELRNLKGPDLILVNTLHHLSEVEDLKDISVNIQVYNGNSNFRDLLDGTGGWAKLRENNKSQGFDVISAAIIELSNLNKKGRRNVDTKTYFDEIYREINLRLNKSEHSFNVIVLSDFDHEFGRKTNTLQHINIQIDSLKASKKELKKISLVELPSTKMINRRQSRKALLSLKGNLSNVKLYAWSFDALDSQPENKLAVFFNSIISIPTEITTSFVYNKHKFTESELINVFPSKFFSIENKIEDNPNSILSSLPVTHVCNTGELTTEIQNTNSNSTYSNILMLKDSSKANSSTEGILKFNHQKILPTRSVSIFVLSYLLIYSTILSILIFYWISFKSWTLPDLYKTDEEKSKQIRNASRKVIEFSLIAVGVLVLIHLFWDFSNIVILFKENHLFLSFLILVTALNIAPGLFYQMEKE